MVIDVHNGEEASRSLIASVFVAVIADTQWLWYRCVLYSVPVFRLTGIFHRAGTLSTEGAWNARLVFQSIGCSLPCEEFQPVWSEMGQMAALTVKIRPQKAMR